MQKTSTSTLSTCVHTTASTLCAAKGNVRPPRVKAGHWLKNSTSTSIQGLYLWLAHWHKDMLDIYQRHSCLTLLKKVILFSMSVSQVLPSKGEEVTTHTALFTPEDAQGCLKRGKATAKGLSFWHHMEGITLKT